MEKEFDLVATLNDIKQELQRGEIKRAFTFIDLVLSNGDVLTDLESQLEEEV